MAPNPAAPVVATQPAYVAPPPAATTAYVQPSVVYVQSSPVYAAPPVVNYGHGYGSGYGCGYGFQPRYYAQAYDYYRWPRISVGVGFQHGGFHHGGIRVGF